MHVLSSFAVEVLAITLILYIITGCVMYATLPRLSPRQALRPSPFWSRAVIALGPFAWPAWRERWSRAVTAEDPANDWKRLVVRMLAWGGLVAIGLAATWVAVGMRWQATLPTGQEWSQDDAQIHAAMYASGFAISAALAMALVIIPGALVAVNVAAILIRQGRASTP